MKDTLGKSAFLSLDRFLGISIMGATGGAIGFYIGGILMILGGLFLGGALGYAVAGFGARIFFISVLVGFSMGALLSVVIGRVEEVMVILAGSGAAAGGFIGINIELLKRGRKKP